MQAMLNIRIPFAGLSSKAKKACLLTALVIAVIAFPAGAYGTGQMAFQQHARANSAYSEGDYQTAVKHHLRATDMANEIPRYRVALAHTYHALGQYGKAIGEYTTVLELQPGLESALCGRATTYAAIGAHNLAQEDLRGVRSSLHSNKQDNDCEVSQRIPRN